MKFMKKEVVGKKGAELSLNTIIIWVLGAVVLAVVIYFFLTGTGRTSGSISDIFKTATAGVSRDLAIETCEQRCESIQDKSDTIAKNSAYCKSPFKIDDDGDGQPEEYLNTKTNKREPKKFYCGQVPPPRDGEERQSDATSTLNVPCSFNNGNSVQCS